MKKKYKNDILLEMCQPVIAKQPTEIELNFVHKLE